MIVCVAQWHELHTKTIAIFGAIVNDLFDAVVLDGN